MRLLSRVKEVSDERSAMPILKTILLTAAQPAAALGAGTLRAAATDLYRSASGVVDADVDEGGIVALPSRGLFERIKAMPDGQVTIEVDGNSGATIKAGKSSRKYTLQGMPGDSFPNTPDASTGAKTEIPVSALAKLFDRVQFAISDDTTRAHLNSMRIEVNGTVLRGVATDGNRLAIQDVAIPESGTAEWMVTKSSVVELQRLIKDSKGGGLCAVSSVGAWLFFEVSGVQFGTKLVDAKFPPYGAVSSAPTPHRIRANRVTLTDSVSAVSVAAPERPGGIKLTLSSNSVMVTAESSESGIGSETIGVEYNGPQFAAGFNAKYMLAPLSAIDSDEIDIFTNGDPLSPLRVTPVTPEGEPADQYQCILMPMRL
jgi:DNA polymerase-3 subunit beta